MLSNPWLEETGLLKWLGTKSLVSISRHKTARGSPHERLSSLRLVGADTAKIVRHVSELLNNEAAYASMSKAHNPYGDGTSAEKIVTVLCRNSHATL
jgi:UDP-N-acetylglucosamine 2-epimerase